MQWQLCYRKYFCLALNAVPIKKRKLKLKIYHSHPFLQGVYIAKYKVKRFHKQFTIIYAISLFFLCPL